MRYVRNELETITTGVGAGNLSLWLERYSWTLKTAANVNDSDKDFDKDFVLNGLFLPASKGCRPCLNATGQQGDERTAYKEQYGRYAAFLREAGAEPSYFKTTSRLVCGIGESSPLENGIALHPLWGVPYIPGSSIKGLLRAWYKHWEQEGDSARLKRRFGTLRAMGELTFFDALPEPGVALERDVLTPHQSTWYNGKAAPGDWNKPQPNEFLTVPKGTSFVFGIATNGNVSRAIARGELSEQCIAEVRGALKEALTWLGIGAKTAVGYGRLVPE